MIRFTLAAALLAAMTSLPLAGKNPDTASAARKIDDILAADWNKNKLQPNPPAGDETFVRRIYLDITGRIPTCRETEEFLASKESDKRARLIDHLLDGEGYVQHFFNYWADILRAQSQPQKGGGSITGAAFTDYIKDSLRKNKPYDQFVREMVSAQGKAWENGAIGYYLRDRDMPLDNMATTVRVFLGTRIECAQCHNHPFDKWTQMQFYEMAAFTYGVRATDYEGGPAAGVRKALSAREQELRERQRQEMRDRLASLTGPEKETEIRKLKSGKGGETPEIQRLREDQRYVSDALKRLNDPFRNSQISFRERKLVLPDDYKYPDSKPKAAVQAAVMMGPKVECPPGADGLKAYAEWMTSRENPRFTTVVANRLWKKVFGLGLIEPVDEIMDGTVAMNPELMRHLSQLMQDLNYDMKSYLRVLFNTRTYQRCVNREEIPAGMVCHFTGPVLRRMSAEQMWDSFVALINPTPDMPNIPLREAARKKLMGIKKLNDALESLTTEELTTSVLAIAEEYRGQTQRLKKLQKEITEARAADDKEKVRELSKDLGRSEQKLRADVSRKIFVPALQKLAAKANSAAGVETGGTFASLPSLDEKSMSLMAYKPEEAVGKIEIPGYDLPVKTAEENSAEEARQTKVMLDEAEYFGIPEKERKYYLQYRRQQQRQWLRSAEIESPAPRGHYLREFGQSDREMVENANSDASVPQALAMMNGQLLPQIMEKYSQLMLTINKAKNPDDQVTAAYMALLSRRPTDNEKRVWLEARNKGLGSVEDLVYALINTRQFIFIQ